MVYIAILRQETIMFYIRPIFFFVFCALILACGDDATSPAVSSIANPLPDSVDESVDVDSNSSLQTDNMHREDYVDDSHCSAVEHPVTSSFVAQATSSSLEPSSSFSQNPSSSFSQESTVFSSSSNSSSSFELPLEQSCSSEAAEPMPNNGIPYIRITVPDSTALNETDENGESVYSEALIEIAGNGLYGDVKSVGKVRYRGNSTRLWYPKKPYRIKFNEKVEVLGLAANKDWVLLANYRDQSKFMNAVVFDMARNMGNFKFVNANRFVEVEVNGDYKGIYQLTEQIEQAVSRVNIDKTTGILFNMDQDDGPELNTWDHNNFWSSVYKLPMAVKYPKDMTASSLEGIQADFAKVEQAAAEGDFVTFSSLMDLATFIDYLIIQEVTRNVELEAPRSTYLYKENASSKYAFGPIWDYDGGFGYSWNEDTFEYFGESSWILSSGNPSKSPFNCVASDKNAWGMCNSNRGSMGGFGPGVTWDGYGESGFFTNLFANEEFLTAYKARWDELKGVLYSYATGNLDEYVTLCKNALDNDAVRWPAKRNYATDIASLKNWLQTRINDYTRIVENY